MHKRKLQTNTHKLFTGLLLSLFLIFALVAPFFNPSRALAAPTTTSDQHDRTILYALIYCLEKADIGISDDNGAEDMRRNNIGGIMYRGFDVTAAVGYEIDDEDGNAACSGISLTSATRALGKTPRWFFNQMYDLQNPEDDGGNFRYKLRSGMSKETMGQRLRSQAEARGLDDMTRAERLRRLATAFWVCAEPAPDPPDRPTTTYGGKKYQLKSNAPGEVSVGYDFEKDNGKFSCDTLMNWGNKAEMAAALRENPSGSTPGGAGNGGQADGDDASVNDVDCSGGGALGWIICPVFELGANMTQEVFDNMIRPMMEQVPVDTKGPFYKAWQNFRFLGNIVLIGAMLALVYAQARGGGR